MKVEGENLVILVKDRAYALWPGENSCVECEIFDGEDVHVENVGEPFVRVADSLVQFHHANAAGQLDKLHHLHQLFCVLGLLQGTFSNRFEIFANPTYPYKYIPTLQSDIC